jgi:hypothetical protein
LLERNQGQKPARTSRHKDFGGIESLAHNSANDQPVGQKAGSSRKHRPISGQKANVSRHKLSGYACPAKMGPIKCFFLQGNSENDGSLITF